MKCMCILLIQTYIYRHIFMYVGMCAYLLISFSLSIYIIICTHKDYIYIYIYTGWNDKIVALEKIRFPFKENHFFFFFLVADHLLVGHLCTNSKRDRSLLSRLKVTQYSTSEIGDAPLYNSSSLPIQVMTTGPLTAPSKCKSGRFNA